MFYNQETQLVDYRDTTPKKVLETIESITESIDKDEEIDEIGYRTLFYIMTKVQNSWSSYYRYRDLMTAYYKLFNKVNLNRNNFDSGAIYGTMSISQRYLNEYLRRHHRRMRVSANDIRDVKVMNELRRVGIRYQVVTTVKGHGRYSSMGEGQVVTPRYTCNVCTR